MKATDLRIGYWYNPNKPTQLDRVTFHQWIALSDDCPAFKPIPLTEEWLIKFGFNFWGGATSFCDRDDFWAITMENGTFIIEHLDIGVEYVHQLQNLYHALTGEELEIKETER